MFPPGTTSSGREVDGGRTVNTAVETTQIAPTILRLLGLNPQALKSVQIEGTQGLQIG